MCTHYFYTVTIRVECLDNFRQLMLTQRMYFKTLNRTLTHATINVLISNVTQFYVLNKWIDKHNY